jgi:hypothetical protein
MQMANTCRATYEAAKTGGNDAGAGGSGENNVNHNEPHPEPHLPPPPPLTAEVFFAQFLGSQRNAEQSQKNIEDFLRTITQKNRPCECDMCYGSHSYSSDSGSV